MNRTRLDLVIAAFVVGILVVGGGLTWETYRQTQVQGDMMGHMVTTNGPDPVWYLLGTLLVAGFIAGSYLVIRDQLGSQASVPATGPVVHDDANPVIEGSPETEDGIEPATAEIDGSESVEPDGLQAPAGGEPDAERGSNGFSTRPRLLDVLPGDERRILEPVIASPGLTQIELRDRSNFSKSKVSQTVSDLEKRGLLYRERQGRTFRVYPSDDLENGPDERFPR